MIRLCIVEGLPCSGKSTMAHHAARLLEAQGRRVVHVDEGTGNHPADYEFHAWKDGQIIPLGELPPAEQQALMPCKIYDGLPWKIERPLMLEKWRQFLREAEPEVTYVFNCVLLQNPMCETMMRFGMTEAESAAHIREIAEIIRPMEPVVIYLHSDDPAGNIRRTQHERPGWLEGFTDYHLRGAYGRSIGATGFAGLIDCLEERQWREERILQELPVRRLILRNVRDDGEEALRQLQNILQETP